MSNYDILNLSFYKKRKNYRMKEIDINKNREEFIEIFNNNIKC